MAESNGLWLDKDTGKVVKKQPSRGRLLVAPGKDTDSAFAAAVVKRYEENYEQASAPDNTEKAVSSATAAPTATKFEKVSKK